MARLAPVPVAITTRLVPLLRREPETVVELEVVEGVAQVHLHSAGHSTAKMQNESDCEVFEPSRFQVGFVDKRPRILVVPVVKDIGIVIRESALILSADHHDGNNTVAMSHVEDPILIFDPGCEWGRFRIAISFRIDAGGDVPADAGL